MEYSNFFRVGPIILKWVLGFISVFLMAALLKLEITVSFLWLSLSVHSGSLKRI